MMRVPYTTSYREGSADVALAAERLAAAQRQVSSGQRLAVASDDPVGAASVLEQQGMIARIDAYTAAQDAASSRLTVADSVLSDIIDKITAAQTAALGAQGSQASANQRNAAVQQLNGLRDALLNDFNTQFNGTYLFGGTRVLVAPYAQASNGTVSAYQGNTAENAIEVDPTRTVSLSFDGSRIAQGGDPADVFTVLSGLTTAIAAGDSTGISQGLAALRSALDRATVAQTAVGEALNTLDDAGTQLTSARVDAVARVSKIRDADMAAAITEMTRAQNAYSAALGAFATVGRLSLMDYLR